MFNMWSLIIGNTREIVVYINSEVFIRISVSKKVNMRISFVMIYGITSVLYCTTDISNFALAVNVPFPQRCRTRMLR